MAQNYQPPKLMVFLLNLIISFRVIGTIILSQTQPSPSHHRPILSPGRHPRAGIPWPPPAPPSWRGRTATQRSSPNLRSTKERSAQRSNVEENPEVHKSRFSCDMYCIMIYHNMLESPSIPLPTQSPLFFVQNDTQIQWWTWFSWVFGH